MTPVDLSEWFTVAELPARTNGLISTTHAKRLFRERKTNGLEESQWFMRCMSILLQYSSE